MVFLQYTVCVIELPAPFVFVYVFIIKCCIVCLREPVKTHNLLKYNSFFAVKENIFIFTSELITVYLAVVNVPAQRIQYCHRRITCFCFMVYKVASDLQLNNFFFPDESFLWSLWKHSAPKADSHTCCCLKQKGDKEKKRKGRRGGQGRWMWGTRGSRDVIPIKLLANQVIMWVIQGLHRRP